MVQTFAHGYALLIGVGQCADSRLSLPATVRDMQALRQILVNPDLCAYPNNNQHLRLLNDREATQQGILAGLAWLKTQVRSDPQATAIVYYSGHGWLETDSNRYYLIPHDFDIYDKWDTALSADTFNQALRQISAKRLLVILDCCHAAGMASAKGEIVEPRRPKGVIPTADPKGLIDALSQGEGRVVFTSCRGKQSSWVRDDKTLSIYTHHLIEALQGAASQPGATEVTVFDLANHLGKAVPESAAAMGHEQNPRFEMADTERFAIALLQGGKGLPKGGWEEVKAQSQSQIQITIDNSVTQTGDRNVNIGTFSGGEFHQGDRVYYQSTPTVMPNQEAGPRNNFGAQQDKQIHLGDTFTSRDPSEREGQDDTQSR